MIRFTFVKAEDLSSCWRAIMQSALTALLPASFDTHFE